MKWLLLIVLCSACHCRSRQAPIASIEQNGPKSTKTDLRTYFSGHEEPVCPHERDWGTELSVRLVHLAETVEMPPWAGIRAAHCFMEQFASQSPDTLKRWVAEPRWAGLGRVVLMELSKVDEPLAVQLAALALEGHLKDFAVRHLGTSEHAGVREQISQHHTP